MMSATAESKGRIAQSGEGDLNIDPEFVAEKHIIRNAYLAVRVDDVVSASKRAQGIAKDAGGFAESTQVLDGDTTRPVASVSLRVPVALFDAVVAQVLELGEVVRDTQNSEDVSADVADLDARLRVMRAEEESLVTILRSATKIGDVLAVKERLTKVRQDIEGMEARVKTLRRQSAMSTIQVEFTQTPAVGVPGVTQDWAGKAWANAVNGLAAFGVALGQMAITLFVFLPVWGIPLAILALIARRAARRRGPPPPPRAEAA